MKAILVLVVMAQYQVDAGQMLLRKVYSAAGCSSQQTNEDYIQLTSCSNLGSSSDPMWLSIVCNGNNPTATKYTASGCASVDDNYNQGGYASGVHNNAGACVEPVSGVMWETVVCAAVDTALLTFYTDAACMTAATTDATETRPVNSCTFSTSSGGSNGTTTVTGEKTTILANGKAEIRQYTNNACTGDGTVTATIEPNTCTASGSRWYKWGGTISSGSSSGSGTASKTPLQHGFLAFPLFMGVATILF